jgi:sugar phosphate isomerase/epimerase
MNLAFSTNAYLKFSFVETVRRLARIGYTGVEIMADVPHAWPAYLLDEQKPLQPRGASALRLTHPTRKPSAMVYCKK